MAWGSAAFGPDATMMSNGIGSLPFSRMYFSISQATSFSVIPEWISLAMKAMAVSAMKAALRMQEISSSSFTALRQSTISSVGANSALALSASSDKRRNSATESTFASNPTLASFPLPVSSWVNLWEELLTAMTSKSGASCLACSK